MPFISPLTSALTYPSPSATGSSPHPLEPLVFLLLAKSRRVRGILFSDGDDTFVSRCRLCKGRGKRSCTTCSGRGFLELGGFSRRNTVRMDSLVGSQWTSRPGIKCKVEERIRWRHFLCVGRKGKGTKNTIAQLSSTCGPPENRIVIDVPISQLKDRSQWMGGWITLAKLDEGEMKRTTCRACSGLRAVPCPRCDGLGQVGL